jgi:hypothetical protein
MKTAAKKKLVAPKAFRGRIILFFWLAIAALHLLLSAPIAPAKSTLGLENRAWNFFSSATQSHQADRLQVAEAQRERAPPQRSTAPGCVLGPETTASQYSAIGSTGQIGQQWLVQNLGGESQVYFNTSLGGRYIDQLANGIANESKVGYTSLTQGIQLQIAKDVELLNAGTVGCPSATSERTG